MKTVDLRRIEDQITNSVELKQRPVAVSFVANAPAGMKKFEGTVPSGCTFWKLAAEGRTFYTEQGQHYNCAVGCYTHSIALPPERAHELPDTVNLMASIGYIRLEEVGGIPHLAQAPGVVVYSPLADATGTPDVVLFVGRPGKLMLLQEAAIRAGVGGSSSTLGRPTCASLPAAMSSGVVVSSACVGNRVYTDLADDELYITIAGKDLEKLAIELDTIVSANQKLTAYHIERKTTLTARS